MRLLPGSSANLTPGNRELHTDFQGKTTTMLQVYGCNTQWYIGFAVAERMFAVAGEFATRNEAREFLRRMQVFNIEASGDGVTIRWMITPSYDMADFLLPGIKHLAFDNIPNFVPLFPGS